MEMIVGVLATLAILFLVSRGLPGRLWPIVIAGTLAVILLVVMAEQYGWWPASWKVR